mgnify:CR=1 FL=1
MNCLEEKILKDGIVKEGNVLKVDSFLNHQMDIDLFNEMGKEFKHRFEGKEINKILTIEASGIGIACVVAQHFHVPVVFAKKRKPSTMKGMLVSKVFSFTKNCDYDICVSSECLQPGEKILFIDDFLANGNASKGAVDLISQAGAELVGMGFIIEKTFQSGRGLLEGLGVKIESLAQISSLDDCCIKFVE